MRSLLAAILGGLILIAIPACSISRTPPVGRWEGAFDARDAVVAVRLEIDSKGEIYLCAPDVTDADRVADDQRPAMHEKLSQDLSAGWGNVEARRLEFDGRVFRKPGGIAPQLEWNPETRKMTAVLYLGTRAALRVPLHEVPAFDDNPWAS